MPPTKKQFQEFLIEVAESKRFPDAVLEPPVPGENIAIITGQVSSRQDHEAIVEIARQHGFHLFARDLFIPCESDD